MDKRSDQWADNDEEKLPNTLESYDTLDSIQGQNHRACSHRDIIRRAVNRTRGNHMTSTSLGLAE
jgi:hypothetical protein